MREAKRRKHIEKTKDLPIRQDVHGRLLWTITLQDRLAGKMRTLDLRVSMKRRNSYDVLLDGQPWKKTMSASRVSASLRKLIVAPQWIEEIL